MNANVDYQRESCVNISMFRAVKSRFSSAILFAGKTNCVLTSTCPMEKNFNDKKNSVCEALTCQNGHRPVNKKFSD